MRKLSIVIPKCQTHPFLLSLSMCERTKSMQSKELQSEFCGGFDFLVSLLSGKEPFFALRSLTQCVCVFFFRAVFFCWIVEEGRGVCVFVHVRVCVCALQYSKSFLWMKWDVNLTSVQNENVGWFAVFAEAAFDLHQTSKSRMSSKASPCWSTPRHKRTSKGSGKIAPQADALFWVFPQLLFQAYLSFLFTSD